MSQQTKSGQVEERPAEAASQDEKPQIRIPDVIPVIGSGSTVMYPQQLMPVLATEERDIKSVEDAAAAEVQVLGLFAQKAGPEEGQYEGELRDVGTAATIVRMAKAPDGTLHAILQGVARIRLQELVQSEPWMRGRVERLEEKIKTDLGADAQRRCRLPAGRGDVGSAAQGAGRGGGQRL
jgi:ATP-dependent Lon protease